MAESRASSYPSAAYSWYVVALLTLAYVISFLDRQMLAMLIEPIKASLRLSDTQVGLLLGPAFAVFYVTLGYPVGILADRTSRKAIVAAGISIWCVMTALCGLARNFAALFAARVGVGIGEATLTPTALSLISDSFPRERRGRPIGVYMMGISLGSGLAYLIGGRLLESLLSLPPLVLPVRGSLHPWQTAFLVVGSPGLLLAGLIAGTREPGRQELRGSQKGTTVRQAAVAALRYMRERWRAFSALTLGMCVNTTLGYIVAWNVALFQRRWGWSIGEIGFALGVTLLVFGPLGTLLGGTISDRLACAGHADAPMRATLGGIAIMVVLGALYPVVGSPSVALALFAPYIIAASSSAATGAAAIIAIAPNEIRAQATALYWIVKNLVGLMVGPLAVGLLTDFLFKDPARVGDSMALAALAVGLPGVIALLLGMRDLRHCAQEVAGT